MPDKPPSALVSQEIAPSVSRNSCRKDRGERNGFVRAGVSSALRCFLIAADNGQSRPPCYL